MPPLEVGETGLCWVVYERGWCEIARVTRYEHDFIAPVTCPTIVRFGPRVPYWTPDQTVEPTDPVEVDARILALRLTKLLGQALAESTAPVVYKLSEASKLSTVLERRAASKLSPERLAQIEAECLAWAGVRDENGCVPEGNEWDTEDIVHALADLLHAYKGLTS